MGVLVNAVKDTSFNSFNQVGRSQANEMFATDIIKSVQTNSLLQFHLGSTSCPGVGDARDLMSGIA